jgi:aconitate hydratase 2/2-methylisocitrate dehydratase
MNGRHGDSLTKVSKGVAFGADSGTVAFAFTSETFNANSIVKVTFKGEMATYMDFNVVHATQSQMLKQFGGENVFKGEVLKCI